MIQNCHHVVEMGPGAGEHGGEVVFSGCTKDFLKASTVTSQIFKEDISKKSVAPQMDQNQEFVKIKGCSGHNLKSIDVAFPLNQLTAVQG